MLVRKLPDIQPARSIAHNEDTHTHTTMAINAHIRQQRCITNSSLRCHMIIAEIPLGDLILRSHPSGAGELDVQAGYSGFASQPPLCEAARCSTSGQVRSAHLYIRSSAHLVKYVTLPFNCLSDTSRSMAPGSISLSLATLLGSSRK